MRFRFIDAERAGLAMPIFRLCRLLQVSVSGFYAWRNRGPSQRQLDDMVLLAHVRAAFRRSRESYGAERVHHELAENGIEVGRHRVARLMRGNGLSPKRKQKFKKTTDSQHNKAVASNLLDQNFSAEAPNEKWAADISYIWTAQGWLYLAVMLDLYSRRVIGWAVGARMTSDLPLRALNRAIALRQPGAGVIHHSDRGSQYCSDAYQARLGELGFLASMSGKGNCYDNAVVETFFKTIKSELIWRTVFMSRSQAETGIAGYIDGFYNPVRRHSTLDFTSPVKFEAEAMQFGSWFGERCRAPPLFLDGSTRRRSDSVLVLGAPAPRLHPRCGRSGRADALVPEVDRTDRVDLPAEQGEVGALRPRSRAPDGDVRASAGRIGSGGRAPVRERRAGTCRLAGRGA